MSETPKNPSPADLDRMSDAELVRLGTELDEVDVRFREARFPEGTTTRAETRPSPSAVETVTACGSRTPASAAARSQATNMACGVGAASSGSNPGRSPAKTRRLRRRERTSSGWSVLTGAPGFGVLGAAATDSRRPPTLGA